MLALNGVGGWQGSTRPLASAACGLALMTLAACSSMPGRTTVENDNPVTGHTRVTHERIGPVTTLPPGWNPEGQVTQELTIGGRKYTTTFCVARQLGTDCIYINLGRCDAVDGWQKYCPNVTEQDVPPPRAGQITTGNPGGSVTPSLVTEVVPDGPRCGNESGDFSYDELTGDLAVSFTTACEIELSDDLTANGVFITPPGYEEPVSWQIIDAFYDGVIPVGSRVDVIGGAASVVWDFHVLGRRELTSAVSIDGAEHSVDAGIFYPQGLPPIAFVAIDGQIWQTMVVTRP